MVPKKTFGIIWNETVQLCLSGNATHIKLQQFNAVLKITIRESAERSITSSLPYTAHEFTATKPLVKGDSTHYSL